MEEEVRGKNTQSLPPGWIMKDEGRGLGWKVKFVLDYQPLPQCQKSGYVFTSAAGVLGERGEDMKIYRI